MAKYTYEVSVMKQSTYCGSIEVISSKKLTEDEVIEKAEKMLNDGAEPSDDWEETNTQYDDFEIGDGHDDLKEEK